MTKTLVVGDIHLSKSPPSKRTSTYCDDILAKLDHTIEIAHEQKVDQVLWLGDVYHNPRPDRISHELTKAVSVRARAYDVPLFIVPGNHDQRYPGEMEGVYVSQPVALLDELPNVTLMRHDPVAVNDVIIHPVPYLSEINVEDFLLREPAASETGVFHLQAVHQSIARDGTDSLPYAHIGAEVIAAAQTAAGHRAGLVVYGHLHENFGLYEIDGLKFANFGSISRGSVSQSDLKKDPVVMVLETNGAEYVGFETFGLRHRPAEDVFRLEEYLAEKAKSQDMEEFVASIQRISISTFSLDTVIDSIGQREDVKPDVRDYAVDCINKVRA